ncbi:TPA: glutamate--tRNA ligase, partial [Candidatus Micrarchaeota archaeon]|nr:glutamate--tRNA ligase [Candidatus Micrarchaeota archaeon]
MDRDVYELAYKHALKNAVEHGGRASVGAVMGKVLRERPDLRERAKDIIPIVKKAVEDVNALSPERQREEMEKYDYSALKKREKTGLPELPNVGDRVVTRFPPEPGGYIHLGNLRSALVS